MIRILNPIIRGWSQYHNHAVSSAVFSKLDDTVYNMLISWAKRRHSNKGLNWIMTKYWHKSGSRNYVFCTELHTLERFSNAKIVRQRLASLHKNPFIDKDYFEQWNIMEYNRKKPSLVPILFKTDTRKGSSGSSRIDRKVQARFLEDGVESNPALLFD